MSAASARSRSQKKNTAMLPNLSRRGFLTGLSIFGTAALAGCVQTSRIDPAPAIVAAAPPPPPPPAPAIVEPPASDYAAMYAGVVDEGYSIPAINHDKVDQRYLRQIVDDPTGEPAGSIVVDTANKYLYLVMPGGKAMRYGVGLGRQGYSWKGRALVQWKRKWPTWTPPAAMIKRDPKLEKWREGMPPGLHNPLGSRALYIFKDGQDTLYRIHGTPDWRSIGKSASAGCVRMFQQDVMDLYKRVPGKAALLVL